MALTPEEFKKRLKITYITLAVLFISMPLSGFFMIVFEIDFPIPILIAPCVFACMFYLFYLKVSNASTIIKMAKPLAETAIDFQNQLIDRVDGKKIGQKIGEVIDGIQNPNNASTPAVEIRCAACNHPNSETDKFCGNCGTKL